MKMNERPIVQVFICIGLLCLIWTGYLFGMKKLNQRIETILEDDFTWVSQIDAVRNADGKFILEGFSFRLDEDAQEKSFEIVLRNINTDEYLFPNMEYVDRKDVNEYFLCEYDYTKSGFVASISERKVDFPENQYEVLVRPKGTKEVRQFGTYLVAGELVYVNPKEYTPLDVEGTDLENIVDKGILRVYEPEVGVFVYQYENELYYIADANCSFFDGVNAEVELHLSTTQYAKLPEDRVEAGVTWDNRSFRFWAEEYEGNFAGYRVANVELWEPYSIKKILTGDYVSESGWIWMENFRPIYRFEKDKE